MLKIYLTGTESSGKTTIAKALSNHYACPWVPEYARQYLQERGGKYEFEDLEVISQGQYDLEAQFGNRAPSKLILDTDQLVLYVWSMYKYGRVSPKIEHKLKAQKGGVHLLFRPDIAWEHDPLRESPNNRKMLFKKYKEALEAYNLEYSIVEGEGEKRLLCAIKAIEAH